MRARKRGDGLNVCRCGQSKHPNSKNCRDCYHPLWRPDQDAKLREFVADGWEYTAMARIIKRTAEACRNRASALGLRQHRAATLENRKKGRDRFYANPAKAARRIKRLLKSFTKLDRAIRAEELRQRNKAGITGLKGEHHTPEVCARISAANKGRSHSPETKARMSEAAKRRWAAHRDGGQAAYRAALEADRKRLRRYDAEAEEVLVWCAQCERKVSHARAAACESQFCKAKALAA